MSNTWSTLAHWITRTADNSRRLEARSLFGSFKKQINNKTKVFRVSEKLQWKQLSKTFSQIWPDLQVYASRLAEFAMNLFLL